MVFGDVHGFSDRVAVLTQQGEFFRAGGPVWIARAPGRLDVLGGNVDFTGGLVLQMPLRQSVWAAVQLHDGQSIRILNPGAAQFGWQAEIEFPAGLIGSAQAIENYCASDAARHWGRYVLGGLHLLHKRHGAFSRGGANLFLASDLPPNRGLASSAALEVAVLKAASAACSIKLSGVALAESAQWVENVIAHSACGIMDQAAIVLGRENSLLPILCQPCTTLPPVRLPGDLRVWGIDSMTSRATGSAAYEQARAASFMGYRMICRWESIEPERDSSSSISRWTDARWKGYLSNLTTSEFRALYEKKLPETMRGDEFLDCFGFHADSFTAVDREAVYPIRAAVRYAVEENSRIRMARTLLSAIREENRLEAQEETLRLFGELFFESHLAYSECGLGSAGCDELVAMARCRGFFGARMTGGGGGGVVAVLGRADQQDSLLQMAKEYAAAHDGSPRIFAESSNGTDFFPAHPSAAHALPAGMLPLTGHGLPQNYADGSS